MVKTDPADAFILAACAALLGLGLLGIATRFFFR